MDWFDDGPERPSRAELLKRVRRLELENQRLEALLEETFKAWLSDKRHCARLELQLLPRSFEELMATTSTEPTISQIIAEMEGKLGGPGSSGCPGS